ncbi:hypothetical protein [Nocardiopsis alba]|uniref:hypothetical protein n=1 Tax=Nocardiopsis alba TaxID=53437 RepID=UPI0033A92544
MPPEDLPDNSGRGASTRPRTVSVGEGGSFSSTGDTNIISGGVSGGTVIQARSVTIATQDSQPGLTLAVDEAMPVGQVDPAALQVHAAVLPAPDSGGHAFLTPYLHRTHDAQLRDHLVPALGGDVSVLVMMTGESSTGKTRSLYEALHELAPHRFLLCPKTVADLLHLLNSGRVDDQAVLWLNEAQHFFYGTGAPEAAATLQQLLMRHRGIVAVGTLWTKPFWEELTRSGTSGDQHGQVRELLTCPSAIRIPVPDCLTPEEQHAWRKLATRHADRRVFNALDAGSADRGRVVQHLSGGPELLKAYTNGPGHHFTPVEHALLTAAIDARRLGHRAPFPAALLAQAADGELDPRERPIEADWAHTALTALCAGERPNGGRTDVRGALTALHTFVPRAGAEPAYELDEYLDQQLHSQRTGQLGSSSLWQSLLDHTADPDDLSILAGSARARGLLKHEVRFHRRATLQRSPGASARLVSALSADTDPCQCGVRWAIANANLADPIDIGALLEELHHMGDEQAIEMLMSRDPVAQVDLADPNSIAFLLIQLDKTGQKRAVERLSSLAAKHAILVEPNDVVVLLEALEYAGQKKEFNNLISRIVSKNTNGIGSLVVELLHVQALGKAESLMRGPSHWAEVVLPSDVVSPPEALEHAGDSEAVETLMSRDPGTPVDVDDLRDVTSLVEKYRWVEQLKAVDGVAALHVNVTYPESVAALIEIIERTGNPGETAALVAYDLAVHIDLTHPSEMVSLFETLESTGDPEVLERLAVHTASHVTLAHPDGVSSLLEMFERVGIPGAVEVLADRAADRINLARPGEIASLLRVLVNIGQNQAVEVLADRAANHISLTRPKDLVSLLRGLDDARQKKAVKILMGRGLTVRVGLIEPFEMHSLLQILHRSGEVQAVNELGYRALNAGVLRPLPPSLRTYGRELDGTAARAWTWKDLEL